MGEAKRRGTRGERVSQALDRYLPVPIEQIRANHGLNKDAEFLGYVVHIPQSDEFLVLRNDDGNLIQWGWGNTPADALRYSSFEKALEVASEYGKKGVLIALLFDNIDQYFVAWS